MPREYFSDRERGASPRTQLEITAPTWGGLVALIDGSVANGGFGIDFPEQCPDGKGPIGTDWNSLGLAVRGEIPQVVWPLRDDQIPPTIAVLDFLEFCYEHIAEAKQRSFHDFFGHFHLSFDRGQGREGFRTRVNRILARNQMAYELRQTGAIARLAAPTLHEMLVATVFATGDVKLDELLELARTKFLDPDSAVRREALEKLWDAFERLKTLGPGKDKKASMKAVLDKAAQELEFRSLIEAEAHILTGVGNSFHIRHSESTQVELKTEDQVDYLFHRLFALIWLLLRAQ